MLVLYATILLNPSVSCTHPVEQVLRAVGMSNTSCLRFVLTALPLVCRLVLPAVNACNQWCVKLQEEFAVFNKLCFY
jgi:hypothetical protein